MGPKDNNDYDIVDHKENNDAQTSWKRFSNWFWGENVKSYIYPDKRMCMNFWTTTTIRIILTVMLYINTIYRFAWTIDRSISTFLRYQLYFTSWSLYMTLYTETWIILMSIYTYRNGINLENKNQLAIFKHNHIFFILSLGMETVTTLMYWVALYEYNTYFDLIEVSRMIDHILPYIVLIVEYISVGWVFYQKQTILYFLIFIYFPVNIAYSVFGPRDLYDILTWDTVMSYVNLTVMLSIVFGSFAIYALISQKRFGKQEMKNIENKGKILNFSTIKFPLLNHNY